MRHAALREDNNATRLHAVEVLRSLVDHIVLTPEDGELRIDVVGELAGILTVASKPGAPDGKNGAEREADRAHRAYPGPNKRKSRPSGAASACELISQTEIWLRGEDLNLRPSGYERQPITRFGKLF